jgi:hypothetical protein
MDEKNSALARRRQKIQHETAVLLRKWAVAARCILNAAFARRWTARTDVVRSEKETRRTGGEEEGKGLIAED